MIGLGKGRAGHGHGRELSTHWARARAGLGTVLGTDWARARAGWARADSVRTSRVPTRHAHTLHLQLSKNRYFFYIG